MARRGTEGSPEDASSFERQFSEVRMIDGIETIDIEPDGEETKNPIVFALVFPEQCPLLETR